MPLQQTWLPGQAPVTLPQVQFPLTQLSPAGQAWPQAPQLLVVFRAVHTPLQQPDPAGQMTPHPPQLLVSA